MDVLQRFPVVAKGCAVRMQGKRLASVESLKSQPQAEIARCHRVENGGQLVIERPAMGDWPDLRVDLDFDAEVLPYLQTWRDARRHRNILAVEPCNCGQRADGTSEAGRQLDAGQKMQSSLTLSFA